MKHHIFVLLTTPFLF